MPLFAQRRTPRSCIGNAVAVKANSILGAILQPCAQTRYFICFSSFFLLPCNSIFFHPFFDRYRASSSSSSDLQKNDADMTQNDISDPVCLMTHNSQDCLPFSGISLPFHTVPSYLASLPCLCTAYHIWDLSLLQYRNTLWPPHTFPVLQVSSLCCYTQQCCPHLSLLPHHSILWPPHTFQVLPAGIPCDCTPLHYACLSLLPSHIVTSESLCN